MISVGFLFDVLLAALIVWLAWRTLTIESLFRAIVMFVAFGLSMGLAWARMDAPDVALVEVAVGAGLTGALFLAAIGITGRSGDDDEQQ